MPPTRGMFVAIEGCEGAGKSTLIKGLQMEFSGHNVCFTREPGGTEVGKAIGAVLMDGKLSRITPETELFLFLADRTQHTQELIIPACVLGKHVISDRYDGSTFAYQVVGHEHRTLESRFWGSRALFPEPDLYVYLAIPPELGLARVASRGEEKTRFDRKPLEFHQRVVAGYEEFFTHVDHRQVCRIDASPSEEVVFDQVHEVLCKLFKIGETILRQAPRS